MKLSTLAQFSFLYVCSLDRNTGKVYSWFATTDKAAMLGVNAIEFFLE